MTDDLTGQLHALYREPSKHHAYQSVPAFVSEALDYREPIDDHWRGDHCRLAYLMKALPLEDLGSLTDIGANTGFFSLSLAHRFKRLQVTACEPDRAHAKFIRTIVSAFRLANLEIIPKGVTLRSLSGFQRKDAALLLNVLHHAGYDFDTALPRTRAAFDQYATQYLRGLAGKRGHLFFQMGSNWGGDKNNPLVPRDAHAEKLRYMAGLLVDGGWRICRAAYPTRVDGVITYRDVPGEIVAGLNECAADVDDAAIMGAVGPCDLDQFPGEFYKRPLFTCASTLAEGPRAR